MRNSHDVINGLDEPEGVAVGGNVLVQSTHSAVEADKADSCNWNRLSLKVDTRRPKCRIFNGSCHQVFNVLCWTT